MGYGLLKDMAAYPVTFTFIGNFPGICFLSDSSSKRGPKQAIKVP